MVYEIGQVVKVRLPSGYGTIVEVQDGPVQFHRNGAELQKFLYRRGGLVIDHELRPELEYPFESKNFGVHVIKPQEEILALRKEIEALRRKSDVESGRRKRALEDSIRYLSKTI